VKKRIERARRTPRASVEVWFPEGDSASWEGRYADAYRGQRPRYLDVLSEPTEILLFLPDDLVLYNKPRIGFDS